MRLGSWVQIPARVEIFSTFFRDGEQNIHHIVCVYTKEVIKNVLQWTIVDMYSFVEMQAKKSFTVDNCEYVFVEIQAKKEWVKPLETTLYVFFTSLHINPLGTIQRYILQLFGEDLLGHILK